jgi:MFS family permease
MPPARWSGWGGLFFGVTGPLVSTFVPPLVRDVLGERRTAIGAVMAIDNVLLLLLVPWMGVLSDRMSASGRGGLRPVVAGLLLASAGMALFATPLIAGIAGLVAAIVVLNTGINVARSPFQALIADLVPSRYRSLATGSVTFQMCAGAIVFLMLGRMFGMRVGFLIAAGTVLAIAVLFATSLRESKATAVSAADTTFVRSSRPQPRSGAGACRRCAPCSSRRF